MLLFAILILKHLNKNIFGIRKNSSIDLVSDFLVDQKLEDEI